MKKIILILFVIFMSCKNSNPKNKNNDLIDKDIEYVDLIEDFKRKDLTKSPYDSWFTENYNNYELDIETADKIKKLLNRKLSIKVIMGTWCSDSRENVPGFFKLMDYLKFSNRKIQLIGLDVDLSLIHI